MFEYYILKESRGCLDYSWSCCHTHFIIEIKWPFQDWHILSLLKYGKALDFSRFPLKILWHAVCSNNTVYSEVADFWNFSKAVSVFISVWGFPNNENKPVNVTRKLPCYAVLGAAFLGGVCPGSIRLTLPALTEELVPFSSQLAAAADFKEWLYVQKHNSQRP